MFNEKITTVLLVFLCTACNNLHKTSPLDVSKDSLIYKVHNNIIEIEIGSNNSINHSVNIKFLNTNNISYVSSKGKIGTHNFIGDKKTFLDIDSIIRCSNNRIELAYKLTKNPKLPLIIIIDEKDTINFEYNYSPMPKTDDLYAILVSGKAECIVKEGSITPKIENLKKWLYDNGNFMDDSDINLMCDIYKDLSYKSTGNYCLKDAHSVPVMKDFSGNKYKINTNMIADYYYLFATNDSKDLEDFIRDVISENYVGSLSSSHEVFSCYRTKGKGGLLTMFLIGIDKKWNKQIIPVGMVCIDNKPPYITTENESSQEKSIRGSFAASMHTNSHSNNRTPNNLIFSKSKKNILDTSDDFKSLGFSIRKIPNIDISENITVRGNNFRGNMAEFTISFGENVKSITFEYKDVKRKVNLSDKKSPYTFRCYLPLNLGDNYIAITAEDKFGNSFESINETNDKLTSLLLYRKLYYVNMVRIKDEIPDINININNNIDVNVL